MERLSDEQLVNTCAGRALISDFKVWWYSNSPKPFNVSIIVKKVRRPYTRMAWMPGGCWEKPKNIERGSGDEEQCERYLTKVDQSTPGRRKIQDPREEWLVQIAQGNGCGSKVRIWFWRFRTAWKGYESYAILK